MAVRSATTRFTPSHGIGKREILRDARGEFIATNSGFIRPNGRGRLIAEVARLGAVEVERIMFALHSRLRGDRIGTKGHGCSIDLIRDGNPDVAMTFTFPAKMLPETLRVLNSKPRTATADKQKLRENAAKARAVQAEKRRERERDVEARLQRV